MIDFIVEGAKVPPVTAEVMREVDRLMIEVYGVTLLQMMENAGRNLAILGARLLKAPAPAAQLDIVRASGIEPIFAPEAAAQAATGRLFVADIGVPPELYSRLGLSVGPIFAGDTIAEVQRQSA